MALEIADGIAIAGLAKLALARYAPNPEFCMPTSMDIILFTNCSFVTNLLIIYPSKKPRTCKQSTAPINRNPEVSPLRKQPICTKRVILDGIFIF